MLMPAFGSRPSLHLPRHIVSGVHSVCHVALPLVHSTLFWQPSGRLRGYVHCSISSFHAAKIPNGRHREVTSLTKLHQRRLAAQTLCQEAPVVSPSFETGVQSFDYTALAACVRELKDKWTPAKVDQVVQSDPHTLCIRLRAQPRGPEGPNPAPLSTEPVTGWLWICWEPVVARICTGPPPQRGAAAESFTFGEYVRDQLMGKVMVDVNLPRAWERVALLRFASGLSGDVTHQLHAELMGRKSNVVMTDGAPHPTILMVACQVGTKQSTLRTLRPRDRYDLPPRASGWAQSEPLAEETLDDWRAALEGGTRTDSVAAALVSAYMGMSPSLAGELCMKSGLEPSMAVRDISPPSWAALHTSWRGWLQTLQEGGFVAARSPGKRRFTVIGTWPAHGQESVLDVVDDYYRNLQVDSAFGQLRQQIASALGGALKRAEIKVANLRRQMSSTQEAATSQHLADLLQANVYRWKPGMPILEVEDWEADGALVQIPIPPLKTAADHAAALYQTARRQRRGLASLEPLIEAAECALSYLRDVETQLQLLDPQEEGALAALKDIQEELIAGKYMKAAPDAALAAKGAAKARRAAKRGGASADKSRFRRYLSPGGFEVLVGRNNRENDELSHRVGAPTDLWFHARGCPGSHTVLRLQPGKLPDDSDIQCAADLAAYFSKARSEGKCPVTQVMVKDLKKPPGAPPGMVLLAGRESVVLARPNQSLAARQGSELKD